MTAAVNNQAAQSEKKSIGSAELTFAVHAMLVERRNKNGLVITGGVVPQLMNELYSELDKKFHLYRGRVWRAFNTLYALELRGEANLKKSGMWVADTVPVDYYVGVGELREKLRAAETKTEEMERELESLRRFKQAVSGSLDQCNEEIQSS